ncbi:MAG: LysR family transcriptional regulator [Ilumatobacter sp.]|uniref:LysR family transcriptional regulator n=1 Tax=Ilumatobacter sp. TaxID=1967498 RepID=UPI0032983570
MSTTRSDRSNHRGSSVDRPLLPDITMRQLEYLVAIDDAPTWAVAAERVGVSPSALSQGLAELERRIGVDLFENVGRRRVLRATARPVLDHARQVVTLTTDLTRWSTRLRDGTSGSVRLGMVDVAAVVHFPDVLRSFRSERGDVDLLLSVAPSRALLDDVARGGLDLAVCVEPPEPLPGIDTVALLSETLVVYAPPTTVIGHPSTWGPWVLFPSDSHTRRAVEQRLVEVGARVDIAAESHQPDVLREMVQLGLGWTVLPRTQGETAQADLVVGDRLLERKLVLARRSRSVHDPAADDLAARLRRRPQPA